MRVKPTTSGLEQQPRAPQRPRAWRPRPASAQRASYREDLLTGLAATWVIVGVYVDTFWHLNWPESIESFFTPWHGILYSGAAVLSTWVLWMVLQRRGGGRDLRSSIPIGYGLGMVGLVVFWGGAVADSVWHSIVHIPLESGMEAFVSPPHMALVVGALLMMSSPLRSTWSRTSDPAPGLAAFAPQLLSVVLIVLTTKFITLPLAAMDLWAPITPMSPIATPIYRFYNVGRFIGVSNVLLATIVLIVPVLLLLRRWRPPFGACAILFTSAAVPELAIYRFALWPVILAALAGGLLTDALILWLVPARPPSPDRVRLLATLAPIGLWTCCFAALGAVFDLVWSPILITGSVLLSGLLGLGLGLLAAPPPLPPDTVIDLTDV